MLRVIQSGVYVHTESGVVYGGPYGVRCIVLILLRLLISIHSDRHREPESDFELSEAEVLRYLLLAIRMQLEEMRQALQSLREIQAQRIQLSQTPITVSLSSPSLTMSPVSPYCPATHADDVMYSPLFI